jgi:hypothetical protein
MLGAIKTFIKKLPIMREILMIPQMRASLLGIQRLQQEAFIRDLMSQERYRDPKRLTSFEFQIYSQNGEDGIIAEIFRRIGVKDRTFVEIGVGDGVENNTAFLLAQGWRGIWVEGGAENLRTIRTNHASYLNTERLKLVELFVTRESIAPALKAVSVPLEIDLLSLDVDRNTYWVWEGLADLSARVVVVEYNATFPPQVDWKVDYVADAWWDDSFNYGASLKALELLGRRLGYALVGCDLSGTNAFFVREDLCSEAFHSPFTSEQHHEPPRYWLVRLAGHRRPRTPA